ncbi:proline-rich protein 12 [Ischnura elegans]|uniref:proline-rich protein 12 n=1 Tax=Ischnura elegans TaxID=197161 RepID=UPI001ED899B2|nr:proline-rich protein 12 [Ischnura elegans]
MNLMFRRNFHADKERGGSRGIMGGGGGGSRGFFGFGGGGKAGGGRRSRETHGGGGGGGGGGAMDGESHAYGGHYRTHIFMSPLGGRQGEPLLVGGKGAMYAMDDMGPGGMSSSGVGQLEAQGGRRSGGGGGGPGAAVTLMKWKEASAGREKAGKKSMGARRCLVIPYLSIPSSVPFASISPNRHPFPSPFHVHLPAPRCLPNPLTLSAQPPFFSLAPSPRSQVGGGGKRRKPKGGEDPHQAGGGGARPRPPTPPLVLPPPVSGMLDDEEGRGPYGGGGGKQVSFGGGGGGGGAGTVLSLAALDRDCFIIPVASLDRFLPAGVTVGVRLPAGEKKKGEGAGAATSPTSPSSVSATFLSVLEVEEPKVVVAAHLMTALRPVRPELESPLEAALTHRASRQRGAARELLKEVASGDPRLLAARAILLDNMEDNAHFPFISYYVINKRETDAGEFFRRLRVAALKKFEPRSFHYTAAHTVELFSEVATIARPPFNSLHHHTQTAASSSAKATEGDLSPSGGGTGTGPGGKTTGYIISVYKVFEGDDREIFEKNWLYWTGARMLYRYLPKWVGLRRITLHKSLSRGDKVYLLLCECANFPDDLSAAALLLPALRARLCGYTGLYRASASL